MEGNAMYEGVSTWNPFVGCYHNCLYCGPSFKKTLKRVGGNPYVREGSLNPNETSGDKGGCQYCSTHKPHYHSERLHIGNIPNSPIVFVYGQSDISFCSPKYVRRTIEIIKEKQRKRTKWSNQTYYWQSKNPKCLEQYLGELPDNSIILMTLETNRDTGYDSYSSAPVPSIRFHDFLKLDYHRKVVTIEPNMDFDMDEFVAMLLQLRDQESLQYVWYGFDSKKCNLPEPRVAKAQAFVDKLIDSNIKVRGKNLINKYGETVVLARTLR